MIHDENVKLTEESGADVTPYKQLKVFKMFVSIKSYTEKFCV